MRLGPLEIGLILVIILIVFGVGKLPQVGSAVGKTLRNFKKAQSGDDDDEKNQSTVKSATAGDKKSAE
jgi:sec-independent protein translocase protein TatA